MSSRALILATVLLLIGWFAPALAQENLDAGKTPSQLFAGTCNACHKSPRGLLKTVSPSSLPGFLRQHYTTSPNMAGLLASYLVSNGATDTRYGEAPKGAKDGAKDSAKGAKEGAKEGTRQEAKQEPRPSAGGQPEQLDRWGRPTHRTTPAPQEASAPAADPRTENEPGQAALDPGAAERGKNAKQKLSKRGKPGETAPPREDAGKPSETATREEPKPETPKPAENNRSQSAKVEQPAETPAIRPDPVPQVTPAQPQTAAPAPAPAANPSPAMAAAPATMPAAAPPPVSSASAPSEAAIAPPVTEMAIPLPANALPPPPPAVTASSAPPQPPVTPAGPPVPPISQ